MRTAYGCILGYCLMIAAGCRSSAEILDGRQPQAMRNALGKGSFLLSCPEPRTAGQLLSRRLAGPAAEGGWMSGVERAEYTVAVEGCGEKLTFIVVCPLPGNDCLALVPGPFNTWQINY